MMASSDFATATSQIPGLANLPGEDDDSRRKNYIRESDSEYVKLAKQGGIKDLLAIGEQAEATKEAVAYPKSDWFGHHAMEEADQQKILAERKWHAPDYMTQCGPGSAENQQVEKSDGPGEYVEPRQLTAREERMMIQAKYNNREVPYQSDNLSCWERKDEPPLRSRRHK